MRAALGLAVLLMLVACKGGGDPVEQALRETSAANHAAATQTTAEAEAQTPVAPAAAAAAAACDVEVSFGSYGAGTDRALHESIISLTRGNADVASAEETSWGREGETTLCVHTPDAAAANRIYGAIAAQIPQTATKAPTTVRHRDGRSRASAYPKAG
jgi:hypothetical protein